MSITGTQIVNDLRAEITEPSPTFFSNSRMLYLINLAQNEYVRRTRVLQSRAFTSSVAGQTAYTLPSDWLGNEKLFYNTPVGGVDSWTPIIPTSIEKMSQESPNFLSSDVSARATPSKYFMTGKTINLYPPPISSGTNNIAIFYEGMPTQLATLSDSLSIDDSLYPGVRAYVLWKLWKQDNEGEKAAEEKLNYDMEIGNGFKWKNKRMLDGRWSIDMISFVPYSYNSYNSGAVNGQVNPLNQ